MQTKSKSKEIMTFQPWEGDGTSFLYDNKSMFCEAEREPMVFEENACKEGEATL